MKLVFLGSSEFAVPSLKATLEKGFDVALVVTQPDRRQGRGLSLKATAVKELALERGLKIYQPDRINSSEAINALKDTEADLFVVISYGQILSRKILDIPKIFAINAHASLLPKYRGAAPINWAIINGETTTGVTIMKLDEKLDAGPLLLQKELPILPDEDACGLENRLSVLAADLLMDSLAQIKNNDFQLTPQDDAMSSLAPKLIKENGLIDWGRPATSIYNLVRGCCDWPGAYTYYKKQLIKIFDANAIPSDRISQPQGTILSVTPDGITVSAESGNILVKELQVEGKRRMTTKEFISGHKITVGETLSNKK